MTVKDTVEEFITDFYEKNRFYPSIRQITDSIKREVELIVFVYFDWIVRKKGQKLLTDSMEIK